MKQVLSVAAQAGPILQSARKAAGLNQSELARQLGISQSRVSAIELDPASLSLKQLLAVCSALNLELLVQTRAGPRSLDTQTGRTPPEW